MLFLIICTPQSFFDLNRSIGFIILDKKKNKKRAKRRYCRIKAILYNRRWFFLLSLYFLRSWLRGGTISIKTQSTYIFITLNCAAPPHHFTMNIHKLSFSPRHRPPIHPHRTHILSPKVSRMETFRPRIIFTYFITF